MPEMTAIRLLYTHYYLTIRKAKNSEWQRKNGTSRQHYIKLNIEKLEITHNRYRQYEVKLSRPHIRHTRLTHGNLMSRNDQ